jgi:hypothetical protein
MTPQAYSILLKSEGAALVFEGKLAASGENLVAAAGRMWKQGALLSISKEMWYNKK